MKRIYLTGFMGAGKSTLGPKLAEALGWNFLELDDSVAAQEERSVPQIFAVNGEAYFRETERKILHQTILLEETVIACGGGTPCYFYNSEWMNRNGTVIWLKEDESVLIARLLNEKAHRPLLRDLPEEEVKNTIRKLLAEREPFYKNATITVTSPTVEKILNSL
jgi:shikimate kinase